MLILFLCLAASALASYLINPFIALLEFKGFRRRTAVLGLYLLIGVFLSVASTLALPRISHEIEELLTQGPRYMMTLKKVLMNFAYFAAQKLPASADIAVTLEQKMPILEESLQQMLAGFIGGAFKLAPLVFLVPFVTFFFLADGPRAIEKFLQAVPGRHVEKVLHIFCAVGESLGNYLRALAIESFIVAAFAVSGLFILKMKYSLLLGILVGVSSVIPYIGSMATGAICVGLAAIQFGHPAAAFSVLILFLGIRFIDDWFIQPYVMSRAIELHPLILIFALILGGELFGFLGLLLAAPATSVMRIVAGTLFEWYLTQKGLKPTPSYPSKSILV